MLSAKLLVVFSLQILSVFGLSGNVLLNLPEINIDNINWQQEKVNTLIELLNTLTQVGNVTLVGWQNVWNSDGTLKEIKTIELTILTQIPSQNMLNVEDVDVEVELPVVLDYMDQITSTTGIVLTGSIQQLDRDGTDINFLYVDQNNIFLLDDIMYGMVNLTVTSQTSIQTAINKLKEVTNLPVAVLKYNVDGTLNVQNSVIVPELLASVEEAENVTLPILKTALLGITKAYLTQPESMVKSLGLYMKQNVPGYKWLVLEGNEGLYINRDVYISLQYDAVDIGQDMIVMDLYGVTV